ncbi:hypothetical protein [Streptomyces sp. NPDC047070]|uniref:Gp37-like protein n=1 Tax=Streptomyces sp. NPDC047070 TaxID=3154923 RepID=UPI003457031F
MAIQLLVTDENLSVQGDPLTGWTSLEATTRYNEPASGSVDLPAHPWVMELLQPGNRIVVVRDEQIWTAGPMEVPQDFSWGFDNSGDAPPGTVRVNFSDDLARIAGYITWPDPDEAWSNQPKSQQRTLLTQTVDEMITTIVDENCGPGARAARRIPALVVEAPTGIGIPFKAQTRFEPLLDFCRRVVATGAPRAGVRTVQVGNEIRFGCYVPANKMGTARFSAGLGNLRAASFKSEAPTATTALVAGTEEDASPRTYREQVNLSAEDDWWRVEKYVDGGALDDTDGELTSAGNEALEEGAPKTELTTVMVDTEDLRAGRDYSLGDRVAVTLPMGLEINEIVRAITLQATPAGGEVVTTLIGTTEATLDLRTVRDIRDLIRKVGRLERKGR